MSFMDIKRGMNIMLGYKYTDITDMVYALDSALTMINSDDDPWLHNNVRRAKNFLETLSKARYFNDAN